MKRRIIVALTLMATAASVANAATLTGRIWEEGTFHISTGDLAATSVGPDDWEAAFNTAATRWNTRVPFTITTDGQAQLQTCNANDPNTTFFSDTRCGNPWSGNVVGVSATWASAHNGYAIQTSIVFNNTVTWDVFDGPAGGPDAEFTRVAVHEIGHSIGLDHTPDTDAIMFPSAGDTINPEADDKAGVQLVYGTASLVDLPDINSNGTSEIAVLRAKQSDGRARVQIKESDGTPVRTTLYFSGFDPKDMFRFPDMNASGDPEIGVMESRQSDGRTFVELRDSMTGATVNNIWFSPGFAGLFVTRLPDINSSGTDEIVVLQVRNSDQRVVAQVRDASSKQLIHNVWYSFNMWPAGLAVLPDMNGNGAGEVAALLVRRSDLRLLIQVRDSLTGALITNAWHPPGFKAQGIAVVSDVNANGELELATLVRRDSDNAIGVRLHDSDTGASIKMIWYKPGYTVVSPRALVIFDDNNGNGFAEVGVVMQRNLDSRQVVELRDSSTNAITKDIWLAPGYSTEAVAVLPTINGNSFQEAGVLGFTGNFASQARVYDSDSGSQLQTIFYPLP